MKSVRLLLLLVLSTSFTFGQSTLYTTFISKADRYIVAKKYVEAAREYTNAFNTLGGKGQLQDRYNAAHVWVLAGENDSAFFNLYRLAEKTNFLEYVNLVRDTVFFGLWDDPRWKKLLRSINPHDEVYNDSLAAVLSGIHESDQKYRSLLNDYKYRYGEHSTEYVELTQTMNKTDSMNVILVTGIIDRYGWLSQNVVGKDGNTALWLVIQHAGLSVQERYYPALEKAVKQGTTLKWHLAYLQDRILMRNKKPQLYGSQFGLNDSTGQMELWPIEDPANVNKRREEVGLSPM